MIKPNELRIGNLIQYDHDEHREPPQPLQRGIVKEIHADGVVLDNDEKRKWDRLAGLTLTEELLLKFGFIENNKWFYKEKFLLGYFTNDQYLQADIKFSGVEFGLNAFDIKTVHQLQNLYFALTEEELQFKK